MDLKLPVSGIEVKAELNGQQVTFRLPEHAASGHPGIVNCPPVSLGQLGEGVALELQVELSMPRGTLKATPVLAGPNSATFKLEKLAEFQSNHASTLGDVEQEFQKRVKACPGRDFKTAHGSESDRKRVTSWFGDTNLLAPSNWMPLSLQDHSTFGKSIDLYFKEEYAKQAQAMSDQWTREVASMKEGDEKEKKRKEGPPSPNFPKDFAAWYERCGNVKDKGAWDTEFTNRLDFWANNWFWPKFETHWKTTETMANRLNQAIDVKLVEVVSIARNAQGNEYRVPLVVFDPAEPAIRPKGTGGGRQAAGAGADAAEPSKVKGKGTGF